MNEMMLKNTPLPEAPAIPEAVKMVVRQMDPGLPVPDLVSYYVLENDRKLYLDSEVDNNALILQRMILRWNMEDAGKPQEERKPITLYIFSPGGDVDMMWSLIDTIEASETPVNTVNMGVAASAAGLIFLSGRKRFMLSRSRVIIHEGSARMAGDAVKVMDAGESYKKMLKQMKDYILKRTRISAAVLGKQKCHDWELDAEYCLEHGVCDCVVDKLSEII
ncbi:MAG: ATP-dependent Clp protease proteolytic subunit [Clostridia bacterium]|nr:ATP-dependent Clp protease proteolytic subunit [Clostridia bacterium]